MEKFSSGTWGVTWGCITMVGDNNDDGWVSVPGFNISGKSGDDFNSVIAWTKFTETSKSVNTYKLKILVV